MFVYKLISIMFFNQLEKSFFNILSVFSVFWTVVGDLGKRAFKIKKRN